LAGGVAQALPTDHTGAFAEENTFSSEITVSADIRFSQENASVNTPPEIKVSSEGLFKAKAVKEVDAERDRATPRKRSGEGLAASPASARKLRRHLLLSTVRAVITAV